MGVFDKVKRTTLFKEITEKKSYQISFQKQELKKNIDKHLFLVCAPKSGSTWLSVILENLLNWPAIYLVSAFGHREQEIDLNPLLASNKKGNIISPHQHLRYSKYSKEIIDTLNSKLVLQVRNIFDTIISYRDHLDQESVVVPAAFMNDKIWQQLSEEEKLGFIVDLVVPWYFNFYCGWITSDLYAEGKILMITYNELKSDPFETTNKVVQFINEDKSKIEIEKAIEKAAQKNIRKNKAVAGRGLLLSNQLKERVISYTKYYPGIDFSPIGL